MEWLKNAIEAPKKRMTSSYDILIKKNHYLQKEIENIKKNINRLERETNGKETSISKNSILNKLRNLIK